MGPEEYRRNAEACLRAAQASDDPDVQATQIEMAQAWFRLAELAEKYSLLNDSDEPPASASGP